MIFVNNPSNDPYFNMALEEYLFFSRSDDICMLWQNSPAIIVGKHQNTMAEIDYEYTQRENIPVVRRLSGGGCVFHDMGNLNFTYIVNSDRFGDYDGFTKPLRKYIESLGLKTELSGRNDLLIDGRKFSGNAQFFHKGRLLHHGTILLGADMTRLAAALRPHPEKILSKGIKSVRSRVANLSEFISLSANEFRDGFSKSILSDKGVTPYNLTEEDIKEVSLLADSKYRTYEWCFGYSPKYTFRKKTFLKSGQFEVLLEVCDGVIKEAFIFGDFFSGDDITILAKSLCGVNHDLAALKHVLSQVQLDRFLKDVSVEEFLSCVI